VGPWFSLGWWPGYYNYYDWGPYAGDYYGGYGGYGGYGYDVAPYTTYGSDYVDTMPAVEATTPIQAESPIEDESPIEASNEQGDFYAQALAAFQQGDYMNATRLASHAAIDDPKNPDIHLLLSLGMFAGGQYRGAAMEAHAVAALGAVPDWPKLLGFYGNNVEPYTTHLRALEKFVGSKPSAPEGRFLLGFQYMMEGYHPVAQDQLLQALKLTPRDHLAAQLLTKAGGTIPADIAKQLEATRPNPPTTGPEPGVIR
jgi:tetratricopeptide (TPR) repeat protein